MNTNTLVVRNPEVGELIPHSLLGQWAPLKLDPDWVWVAEQDGSIEGIIIASYAHGMCIFWRVAATDKAPENWLLNAFRAIFKEGRKRGCVFGMAYLTQRELEMKLLRIAMRAGWVLHVETGAWVAGAMEGRSY